MAVKLYITTYTARKGTHMSKIWKLTERELAALGPGLHSDGGGLYVKVSKNGKGRSWVLRYTDPKGRERRMGLGSLKTVSAQEAREKAHDWNKMRDVFKDPIEERRAMKTQAALEKVHNVTVKKILDEYFRRSSSPAHSTIRRRPEGTLTRLSPNSARCKPIWSPGSCSSKTPAWARSGAQIQLLREHSRATSRLRGSLQYSIMV